MTAKTLPWAISGIQKDCTLHRCSGRWLILLGKLTNKAKLLQNWLCTCIAFPASGTWRYVRRFCLIKPTFWCIISMCLFKVNSGLFWGGLKNSAPLMHSRHAACRYLQIFRNVKLINYKTIQSPFLSNYEGKRRRSVSFWRSKLTFPCTRETVQTSLFRSKFFLVG